MRAAAPTLGERVGAGRARAKLWLLLPLVLLACLLAGVGGEAHAEAGSTLRPLPAILEDGQPFLRLGRSLELLEDPSGKLTFPEARKLYEQGRFRPSTTETPNLGFTRSALWARVEIDDRRSHVGPLVLEVAHAMLDKFELFEGAATSDTPFAVMGDYLPFRYRAYQHRFSNLVLEGRPGTSVFFFRATGESSISIPLNLYLPHPYIAHITNDQAAQSVYVGIMLAMVIYNLLLFLGMRESSYLLYSTFILCYLIYQTSIGGLTYQYLWPNFPLLTQRLNASVVVFAASCAQLFALTFLDVRRNLPRLGRATLWLTFAYLAYVPFAMFGPPPLAYQLTAALGLLFSIVVLTIAILSLRSGGRPARIFLLAWGLFLVGNILAALWLIGIAPKNPITENAQQIGSALEGLLLAIALADRVRSLRLDAEVAQSARIREREKAAGELAALNDELRRQVAERSREVAHLLQEIAPPSADEVAPGRVFEGRYRILRPLGKGAMGEVYEVERMTDSGRFALKVLLDASAPELAARFAREAEIAARLRHPNLVSVVDFGVSARRTMFLVMELIDGPTVGAEWRHFGDIPWALPLLTQVAQGLAALHAVGVVHRDLKPSNVLLGKDGEGRVLAKIADFGLSAAHDAGMILPAAPAEGASTLAHGTVAAAEVLHLTPQTITKAGVLLGTPQYMPPELSTGRRQVSPSVDVFAFGVMAIEMLLGGPIFTTPPVYARLAGRPFERPLPMRRLCPQLDATVANLLDRCIEEQPGARPSATEIQEVLSAAH